MSANIANTPTTKNANLANTANTPPLQRRKQSSGPPNGASHSEHARPVLSDLALRQIEAFLDALGHNEGLLELRLISEKPLSGCERWFVANSDRKARREVLAEAMRANAGYPSALLFGINPRIREGGRDVDVAKLRTIVADVDGKGLPLAEQIRRVEGLAKLARPVAVVDSGSPGHRHYYWRIDPPCAPEIGRALGKRLRTWLRADATESISKTMRLPYSLNWKGGVPKRLTLLRFAPGARITADKLEAALDAVGAPQVATLAVEARRAASFHKVRHTRPPSAVARRVSLLIPTASRHLPKLPALPEDIERLLRTGHTEGDGFPSRSEADQAVAFALVRAGLSLAEVRRIFESYPIGEKYRERGDYYLELLVSKAEAFTPDGHHRVSARVTDAIVDRLPARNGKAAAKRAALFLRIESKGEFFGSEITDRFYVPPDPARPWAELRWNAVWRAAGLRPTTESCVDSLRGRRLSIEVTRRDGVVVVTSYLPARLQEPCP